MKSLALLVLTSLLGSGIAIPSGELCPCTAAQIAEKSCPPNNPMENKELVQRAYQAAIGDHNVDILDEYFHTDYIQHNPLAADGIEGLKELVRSIKDPKMEIKFVRMAAEGNLVWAHGKLPFFGKVYAVVDIFRVECGKIKEHWDVLQDTNLTMPSANPHPFF